MLRPFLMGKKKAAPEWINVLGVTDAAGYSENTSANYEVYFIYAANADATITTIRVYCTASCNVHVGIFQTTGNPGPCMCRNNVGWPCTTGWNDIPIPGLSVTNGTLYFIGVITDQAQNNSKSTPGDPKRVWRSQAYAGHVWLEQPFAGTYDEYNGAVGAGYYVGQGTLFPSYAEWNSSDKHSGLALSNFNQKMVHDSVDHGFYGVRSNLGVSAGKHYWELTYIEDNSGTGTDHGCVGVANSSFPATDGSMLGDDTNSWAYRYRFDGNKYYNASGEAFGATCAEGDIISIALDMDSGKVWFAKNGLWQASGDPANGTNPAFSGLSGTIYAALTPYIKASAWNANFGTVAFAYTVPAGFRSGLYA